MIFQELKLTGASLWYSQYFLDHPIELAGSADQAGNELHCSIENHFSYSWDGIGQPTEKQGQGGFSHNPYVQNKVSFAEGLYRTFDFHFDKMFLIPFANEYPKLYEVMNYAESGKPGSINTLFEVKADLKAIINHIRRPDWAPGLLNRYYQNKTDEYLIYALQQMHANLEKRPVAVTPSLIEKAEQLESILRADVSQIPDCLLPSLSQLSKKVGTNVEYIRRAFKERYGKTIFEYHRHLRLEKAKALLLDNPYLDEESIAIQCGFYDSLRLIKAFKSAFEMIPREYRKHGRDKQE